MLQSSSVGTNVPFTNSQMLLKAKRATTSLSKKKYMSVRFENGTLVSNVDVEEWHPNTEPLGSTFTKVCLYR